MSNLFPRWMNTLPTAGAVGTGGFLTLAVGAFWYWATPSFWEVGYMPTQPGSGFSHQIHAGKLGMDCRYCHTNVEKSAEANIPSVSTCNGCHAEGQLRPGIDPGVKVAFVREAFATDASIAWRRVHKLPDYVRNFPHDVHVAAGVSCFSCHGQIKGMPIVAQAQSLSMSWCLDCHRNPGPNLVPKDRVTDLQWVQEEWFGRGENIREAQRLRDLHGGLNPPENCGACHY